MAAPDKYNINEKSQTKNKAYHLILFLFTPKQTKPIHDARSQMSGYWGDIID